MESIEEEHNEHTLAKILEENEDNGGVQASTVENKEKEDSSFIDSLIILNNKLKDKIPDIKINNTDKLLEEIKEIYKRCNFYSNFKGNNYNICEKFGKNNFFFVNIVLQIFVIFSQKIIKRNIKKN